jgi:hypothetical protein
MKIDKLLQDSIKSLHCKLRGVSHAVAFAIYIKKYLKVKEELWKLIYFTIQKYNLPKIL